MISFGGQVPERVRALRRHRRRVTNGVVGEEAAVVVVYDLDTDRHDGMGFFSARRADDLHSPPNDDLTVARVIRSRFVRRSPSFILHSSTH